MTLQSKKFQRRKEDFTCEHCGAQVIGDGYTNHCPECLWSKHVDDAPGDRLSTCNGPMPPVDLLTEKNEDILTHRCQTCGHIKRNKTSKQDNSDALIKLAVVLAKQRAVK
jgi:hypothetical protein